MRCLPLRIRHVGVDPTKWSLDPFGRSHLRGATSTAEGRSTTKPCSPRNLAIVVALSAPA